MGGFAEGWVLEPTFTPAMDCATRNARYAAWGRAVQATLSV
jgi:glycerol kinase